MKNDFMLLSTKLKMPEPRKNYIIRENIFRKLENYEDYKLILVKGGAASGKTTLVASFIKQYNIYNARWITIDESSNNIFSFWDYFIESVKDYLGSKVEDFRGLFDANFQKSNVEQLLVLLINRLNNDEDLVIVLDDFHYINDKLLLETIDFFIKNSSDKIHFIIITREEPLLHIARLNMAGSLLVIDENNLKLSCDEGMLFLKNTMTLNLNDESLELINNLGEGWIGGLQLIAAATVDKTQSQIEKLKLTNKFIDTYIREEIFGWLTNIQKDFLIKTSILSYFDEKICKEFLDDIDFKKIMSDLEQRKLLIISIDDELGIYRYHSILSEYLKNCFNSMDAQTKTKLHIRAAKIYHKIGDNDEYIAHLCAANLYEEAMKSILKMPLNAKTFFYLSTIPIEFITKNPDFAYQCFFYHYGNMEFDKCKEIYKLIKEDLSQDATFKAFKASCIFVESDFNINELDIIKLEEIDALKLNEVTKAFLLIKDSMFLLWQSRYSEALKFIQKACSHAQASSNPYIVYFANSSKTQILEEMGELKKCLELYAEMKKMFEDNQYLSAIRSSYYVGIIGVYLKQMNLTAAKISLENGKITLGSKFKPVNTSEMAYTYNLMEYNIITGELKDKVKLIKELMEFPYYENTVYMAGMIRYIFLSEELNDEEWTILKRYISDYNKTPELSENLVCKLLYGQILLNQGNYNEALEIIDDSLKYSRKNKIKVRLIEAVLLKIKLLLKWNNCDEINQGKAREIINYFIEALYYGYEDKILLPFYLEMQTVLKVVNEFNINSLSDLDINLKTFLKEILNLDKEVNNNLAIEKEILSQRELEVLQKIENGMSNKQIAEELCISLATVKSHIINIYSKLHVGNRVMAVEEARRQNIIGSERNG